MLVYEYSNNGLPEMAIFDTVEEFNAATWNPGRETLDVLPLSLSLRGTQFLTARKDPRLTDYQKRQIVLRERARRWQQIASECAASWGELCTVSAWFEKMGRRYGLLAEFRENGIC